MAVLGAERGVVDLELLDACNRRLEHQRAERQIVGGHPVDQESDGLLTVTARVEGERSSPAKRRRRKSGLRGRHRSRDQQREIDEVPAVQWNRLHSRRRDDMTYDRGRTIDERDLRLDDHRFASVADDQSKVPYQRAAHLEVQLVDDFGSKPCRCRADLICPRGNRCDLIASLAIGADGTVEIGGTVAHAHGCAGKHRAGLVEHTALQCRGRLSMKRRGKERQQSESHCEGKAVTACGNAQRRARKGGAHESSSELRRRLELSPTARQHEADLRETQRLSRWRNARVAPKGRF